MSRIPQALARLVDLNLDEDSPEYDLEPVAEAVDELMQEEGTDDLAPVVLAAVKARRMTRKQANLVLAVATWSGPDNGARIRATLDKWVRQGTDLDALSLALHYDAYPLSTCDEMKSAFERIVATFPSLAPRCRALIADRLDDEADSDS